MPRSVFHARWVVPVTSAPVESGRVVVEDGRITAVERTRDRDPTAIDCGDALILPGFVNAHTHLELTVCRSRVPFDGSFVGWIERLTALYPGNDAGTRATLRESIRDGVQQSLAAGVTTVADVGCGERAVEEWYGAALSVVGFLEVLGMGAKCLTDHERSVARAASLCERADVLRRRAARAEARGSSCGSLCGPLRRDGIAPHAPYSTDPAVYRDAIDFATRTHRPIGTHLAETRDELRFLSHATGPFRELLESRGLWDGSFSPPGCSPVRYAERIGLLARNPLLVHVNYVTDDDLDVIAGSGSAVVCCPRSHRFFGHEPHRYRDMLDRGINVCVGTDSLASNESLSVLDELRFLRRQDERISGEMLLAMGTIAAARALGLEAEVGSLEIGKRADLVVVPLADPGAGEPVVDLLSGGAEPSAVYLAGQRLFPT